MNYYHLNQVKFTGTYIAIRLADVHVKGDKISNQPDPGSSSSASSTPSINNPRFPDFSRPNLLQTISSTSPSQTKFLFYHHLTSTTLLNCKPSEPKHVVSTLLLIFSKHQTSTCLRSCLHSRCRYCCCSCDLLLLRLHLAGQRGAVWLLGTPRGRRSRAGCSLCQAAIQARPG